MSKNMSRGVLVGADATQEWLLPWWWKHYSRHNTLPVTFVDFGLSANANSWCKARGNTIPLILDKSFIAAKETVDPEHALLWERWYGKKMWSWRQSCFNKPFAYLLSPYEETVWLDLDCEIFDNIEPIFQFIGRSEFAIADPLDEECYNSGVVVYKKNSTILKKWVKMCLDQNAKFCGDDYVLTYLLNQEKLSFQRLPTEWNWVTKLGINFFVKIFHWTTAAGKDFIKYHQGIQDFR